MSIVIFLLIFNCIYLIYNYLIKIFMVFHYTNFVVETNVWWIRRIRPVIYFLNYLSNLLEFSAYGLHGPCIDSSFLEKIRPDKLGK